jgi:hypothetical protein
MTATNADLVPQRTPLVAAISIWSSINSVAEDSDTTREDVPTGPLCTRSWTRALQLNVRLSALHLKLPNGLL